MKETKIPAAFIEQPNIELDESDLGVISELATKLRSIEDSIVRAEDAVNAMKMAAKQLSEVAIPDAMARHNLSEVRLMSGHKIRVEPFYSGSLTGPESLEWLDKNGHGGIIKTAVIADFGRGNLEEARTLAAELRERGENVDLKESVHAMTLKGFIREQMENGVTLPQSLFNVYVGKKTRIIDPR